MAIYYSNSVTNFGFNQALVQRKDITRDHVDAIFTFDILISCVLMVLFIALSTPISIFFNAPECEDLIEVMSVLFILTTFHDLPYALLRRNIDFKMISLIDAGREITMALLTLGLALMGQKYWSIVYGRLIAVALTILYLLRKVDWAPRLTLNLRPLKDLFNFGIWTVVNSQVAFFSTRIDRILIGKYLNVSMLGLFDKAKGLAQMPTDSVAQNINNVLFSSFSRAQENEHDVSRLFHKGLVILSVINFPIYVGLYIIAPYFVLTLLGEKWSPMIAALQILSIGGLFATMNQLFATMLIATGAYRRYTRRLIFMTVILFAVCLFVTKFGMEAVAASVAVFSCVLSWVSYDLIRNEYKVTGIEVFAHLLPAFRGSIIMFVIVHAAATFLFNDMTVLNILVLVVLGVVTYTGVMLLVPAEPLNDIRSAVFRDAGKIWGNAKFFFRT